MTATIYREPYDIGQRLADLGLTLEQAIEVVRACAAAHAGCTDNDPPYARGTMVYIRGVRRWRELLQMKGWEKDDTKNFSTIVNHDLRLRIAVTNTDDGTARPDREPRNRSHKGSTAERVTQVNQALLPGLEWPIMVKASTQKSVDDYATWYLCIYIENDVVHAELSLPDYIENGYFISWAERIFLVRPGEWLNIADSLGDDNDAFGAELEIDVQRK